MSTSAPPSRISGPNPPLTDPELFFGLVAPVGTKFEEFENKLARKLERFRYRVEKIRLSEEMKLFEAAAAPAGLAQTEFERLSARMREGNELRLRSEKGEFMALVAASAICTRRVEPGLRPKTAHIIRSLKHPDEVRALRRIYGPGFFLIGVVASESARRDYLQNDKACSEAEATTLLQRDEHEETREFVQDGVNYGQRTRDTFQLADAFIKYDDEKGIERFLDLVFGCPFHTPTRDEHAMFSAYAASLRSGDLSRQVGAVITSAKGDVIALGANDVPRAGGGLYWSDDADDQRDFVRGHDSNEQQRDHILRSVVEELRPDGCDSEKWQELARAKLSSSPLMDITEYGRAVHAEMEAIMACARNGTPPKDGTLYCTTFPCHNCAKHIVDVGIARVVYVEPYPKSQAGQLFGDSILLGEAGPRETRVRFEAFLGVGPRRFFDLFSLNLVSGVNKKRKERGGTKKTWHPQSATVCVPLLPNSYLEREHLAFAELGEKRDNQ